MLQISTRQLVGGTLFRLLKCTLCCVSKPNRNIAYSYLHT